MSDDWKDVVAAGIENYAVAAADKDVAQMGGRLAGLLSKLISAEIRPTDVCSYAMPTALIVPKRPAQCLVAILQDRLVAFWETGMFRTKSGTEIVPLTAITDVSWGKGDLPSLRNTVIMTVTHTGGRLQFFLPLQRTQAVAMDLKAALMPSAS